MKEEWRSDGGVSLRGLLLKVEATTVERVGAGFGCGSRVQLSRAVRRRGSGRRRNNCSGSGAQAAPGIDCPEAMRGDGAGIDCNERLRIRIE